MSDPRKNRGTGRDMKKHFSALFWRTQEFKKKQEAKDLQSKHNVNTVKPCHKKEH